MPDFIYSAMNADGDKREGRIEADSIEEATRILNDQGYLPLYIRRMGENTKLFKRKAASYYAGGSEETQFRFSNVLQGLGVFVLVAIGIGVIFGISSLVRDNRSGSESKPVQTTSQPQPVNANNQNASQTEPSDSRVRLTVAVSVVTIGMCKYGMLEYKLYEGNECIATKRSSQKLIFFEDMVVKKGTKIRAEVVATNATGGSDFFEGKATADPPLITIKVFKF